MDNLRNRREVMRPNHLITNKAIYLYRLEEYCDFLEEKLYKNNLNIIDKK